MDCKSLLREFLFGQDYGEALLGPLGPWAIRVPMIRFRGWGGALPPPTPPQRPRASNPEGRPGRPRRGKSWGDPLLGPLVLLVFLLALPGLPEIPSRYPYPYLEAQKKIKPAAALKRIF